MLYREDVALKSKEEEKTQKGEGEKERKHYESRDLQRSDTGYDSKSKGRKKTKKSKVNI